VIKGEARSSEMVVTRGCLTIGCILFACGSAVPQQTVRVSKNSNGAQGRGNSYGWQISADGRFVVFQSYADNLVTKDWNGREDVFVHDRLARSTERVSVDSNGVEADNDSYSGPISADGRFVAFFSWANNLVVGDTNGTGDIFVHDRATGTTELISLNQSGGSANGPSFASSISADGRYVAFDSLASDLVSSDTNNTYDVFVRDRQLGVTELVSVDSLGIQGNYGSAWPALSADGTIVAFFSESTNLIASDTNHVDDVFVHDRSSGVTERVSIDSSGAEANGISNYPTISADGLVVSFESSATNLTTNDSNSLRDVFVHDRASGATECMSLNSSGATGNDESRAQAAVSADGRFVAFVSHASDLVSNDTNNAEDVFVRDRTAGTLERASVDSAGTEANQGSGGVAISGNGESVVFFGGSTNLVANDTNNCGDVFVHDRCDALWVEYGTGFLGTSGVPGFTAQADPILGSTLTLDLANSCGASTIGLLFLGFQRIDVATPLGGDLLVDPVITSVLALPANGTTISSTLPNNPALCGFTIDLQTLELDPGAAKGVSFTRGLELILGH